MRGENNAVYLTYEGRTQTKAAWAREIGVSPQTLYERIKKHGLARALSMPGKKQTVYYWKGKRITCAEIAELNGTVSDSTVNRWLVVDGISVEEAIHRRNGKQRRDGNVGGRQKPKGCVHPDCDNCPFPDDCHW